MNTKKVAFIGLGKMGTVLSEKLLEANFNLTVYNRTASKMQPLIDGGATGADSMEEAIFDADIIVTCLSDDESLLSIVQSPSFIHSIKPGAIHIGTSSILPSTAKTVTEIHVKHNTAYLGANVLDLSKATAKGELISLVAGNPETIQACTPVLAAYSSKIVQVGKNPWEANMMKVCTHYLLSTTLEAVKEKNELDKRCIEALLSSVFAQPMFKLYVDKMSMRNFGDVNFTLSGGLKDLNLFQETFKLTGVQPDIANVIQEQFTQALAVQMGEKNKSILNLN